MESQTLHSISTQLREVSTKLNGRIREYSGIPLDASGKGAPSPTDPISEVHDNLTESVIQMESALKAFEDLIQRIS